MVAPVGLGSLNSREAAFIREYLTIAPRNAAEAYRRAYAYKGTNADVLSYRLMMRPAVKQAIDEAIEQSKADGVLDMRERRGFLARVVRDKRRFPSPDAGTRINAIREDAILAGERRQDGTQVNVGVVVSLGDVLGGLGGAKALLGGAVQPVSRPVEAVEDATPTDTRPEPQNAPASPVGGLLGLLGPSSRPAVAAPSVPMAEWSDE